MDETAKGLGVAAGHSGTSFLHRNSHAVFEFGFLVVWLQEDGTQGWRKGQGVQCGETNGDGHCQTKLAIERTRGSRHETNWNEHGHHDQGDGHQSAAQFTHGVDGGFSC